MQEFNGIPLVWPFGQMVIQESPRVVVPVQRNFGAAFIGENDIPAVICDGVTYSLATDLDNGELVYVATNRH